MNCASIIYVNGICNNIPAKGEYQQSDDVGGVNFSLKSQLWSHLQMFGDYIETRVTTILL